MGKYLLNKPLPILIMLVLATIFSVVYIDRSFALWLVSSGAMLISRNSFLHLVSEWLPIFILLILVYYLIISNVIFINNTNLGGLFLRKIIIIIWFLSGLKLSELAKHSLKIIFGRYWPDTWLNRNLSLIHDNVYGFNWLHGFANLGSFPSGHSVFTAYCCSILIFLSPTHWFLWIFMLIFMITALVCQNYHFLGDCLAGVIIGFSFAFLFWQVLSVILRKNNHFLDFR